MNGGGVDSSGGSLDGLQRRVLVALSGFQPPFILGGGGALAIYIGHRTTRDLDLFWPDVSKLGDLTREIEQRLLAATLSFSRIQQSPGFVRLRVAGDESVINLDLVADPTARLQQPQTITIESAAVQTESLPDLLANKLCTLLSRSEIRDLIDVQALVNHGVSLDEAIASAPKKDGGFSPLTLAWILKSLDLRIMGGVAAISEREIESLDQFRRELIDQLVSP